MAGWVTLNRPQALNAITQGMVLALRDALESWRDDAAIDRIVVEGAGGRAFSAGGDIRALYDLGLAGRHEEARHFWRDEYRLNTLIKRYPKPYISILDGIVMGGGVGISLHGATRIAGDGYRFAMPEVGIGFFPDVGATYALPRLPGRSGLYIALTGARIGPDDALALGLATHRASGDLAALRERLAAGESLDSVLPSFGSGAAPGPVVEQREVIDRCFAGDDVGAILDALDRAAASGSAFAAETAATMRTKSPMSLAVTLEQMRRGAALDFEEAMRLEFRIVSRIIRGADFYEGVRAALIERGRAPVWRPATLDEVRREAVEAHFAPLDDELEPMP